MSIQSSAGKDADATIGARATRRSGPVAPYREPEEERRSHGSWPSHGVEETDSAGAAECRESWMEGCGRKCWVEGLELRGRIFEVRPATFTKQHGLYCRRLGAGDVQDER